MALTGKKKKIAIGAGSVVGALVLYFSYNSYFYVSTDNAMIQAPTTLLSSKVAGIIAKAEVHENEKVHAGQVLVEIAPLDFQNRMHVLESESDALAAQMKGAETSYQRTALLFRQGASTKERLDAAETQYRSLASKHKSAEALVEEAKTNLGYTKIVAPSDGKVGRKSFEPGMMAQPGQPLLGFVAGNERWVVANIKETEMALITEGKSASVHVDAVPGKTFHGVIESISPTTGATFSLLPPDNATGNFTKVVQHVPVRIKLTDVTPEESDRLQAGLSAEVKVKVR